MSKKTMRRKTRKETGAVAASPVVMSTTAPKTFEFKPDYSYVIKDLRRIGMLAGTFIVILLALSFFLR
jgi:hypothetical protein